MPGIQGDALVQSVRGFAGSLPARFLASGLKVNALRTNALLMKDEWEALDRVVVDVQANTLVAIADLQAMGLTLNLGSLGVLVSQYHTASDQSDATVSRRADVDFERDRTDFGLVGVPVPIIMKGFPIDIRELAASRLHGGNLDTANTDTATRKVSEMQERMLLNGSSIVQGFNTIYGYCTHPSRNIVSGGADWGTASNMLPNVIAMMAALQGDNYLGPYKLYLHSDQYVQTLVNNPNTAIPILRTLEQLPGMGPSSVRPSNFVTAGQAGMVNMTRNVVDLAIAQNTVPIEWQEKGGMVTEYAVFSCLVPRVKAEATGRCGIAHITGI